MKVNFEVIESDLCAYKVQAIFCGVVVIFKFNQAKPQVFESCVCDTNGIDLGPKIHKDNEFKNFVDAVIDRFFHEVAEPRQKRIFSFKIN